MKENPYAPRFEDLPDIVPIFPLNGVLLLPHGELPLNIFEPRYLAMFDAALASNRMIGMVQRDDNDQIYKVGCAGKIVSFTHTTDNRYLVSLSGICRFEVDQELKTNTPYRQVKAKWDMFYNDMEPASELNIDREKLLSLLKTYFANQDMDCDWDKITAASDARLINCLSMACPLAPQEKQALLEATCHTTRANMFMMMLEMTAHGCTMAQAH